MQQVERIQGMVGLAQGHAHVRARPGSVFLILTRNQKVDQIEGKFGVSFEVGGDGGMDAMTKGIVHVGAPCHGEKTAQVLQLLHVYNTLILEGLSSACQSSVRRSYINPQM
jgi:hypothetical protein